MASAERRVLLGMIPYAGEYYRSAQYWEQPFVLAEEAADNYTDREAIEEAVDVHIQMAEENDGAMRSDAVASEFRSQRSNAYRLSLTDITAEYYREHRDSMIEKYVTFREGAPIA